MKKLTSLLSLLALTAGAQTNTVTIQWEPNTETNLAGYIVAYGTNAGWTTNSWPLISGSLTTGTNYTFTDLANGPVYSFAVQAIDTDSLPSEWSDEVVWKSKRIGKPSGVRRMIGAPSRSTSGWR